ncbi:Retrovirus-related Pol polyprotein from transposon RE1 [Bienertia sinuspersici]
MFYGGNISLFSGYNFCFLSSYKHNLVIDSGATHHICNDLNLFAEYGPMLDVDDTITVPDGRKVQIKHVGTMELPGHIKLKNVFHVPDFQFNLVSVHKLCADMNCEVKFAANSCTVQGQDLIHPQALGKMVQGLYCLEHSFPVAAHGSSGFSILASNMSNHPVLKNKDSEEYKLWHLRLGHLPFTQLHKVKGLDVGYQDLNSICQICPAAKQTRLPFPHSSIKSTSPFQLIHVDVWGPYGVSTHNHCKLFLTIVDDFTRHTWVHLLKFKSDAIQNLKNFVAYCKTQFNLPVKSVRCDNAKKLTEGSIVVYYLE